MFERWSSKFHVPFSASLLLFLLLCSPALPAADGPSASDWAAVVGNDYRVVPNVVYKTANQFEAKLDLYLPRNGPKPSPTLIYIHGGGWVQGSKEALVLRLMPYLELGMSIVNVEYRLARVSRAPAAVEDCRCALRWVIQNAEKYGFDITKLAITGTSAGGHLSLITGMLEPSAGLDNDCPGEEDLKVAAVVNFYGITDVADLIEGPNEKSYAVGWLGSLENRQSVAQRVSPLTYVRKGLPPILTIHGDADTVVPYDHAVRLHKGLAEQGVPNQLLTIPGGKHGGFTSEQMLEIHRTIEQFLKKHGVLPQT